MQPAAHLDWVAIKQDYVQNPAESAATLAEKYKVNIYTLRRRLHAEQWTAEREEFAREYAQNLNRSAIVKNAAVVLRDLNDKLLKQNEELRYMLNAKLKTRGADGKIAVRTDVTIPDIAKAVAAFSELYRLDRLALGASTDNLAPANTRESRLAEMSDDELDGELKRVRAMSTMVQ